MSQPRWASVNSTCHSLPLWNRQIAGSARWRSAHPSNVPRCAKARAVTTSAPTGGTASIRPITIFGCFCKDIRRPASPRNAAFRASDSTSTTSSSGRSAARTSPGNPAPVPRSANLFVSAGTSGRSCAESRIWRLQISSTVAGPIRLMAFCHLRSSSTYASSFPHVSRETSRPRPTILAWTFTFPPHPEERAQRASRRVGSGRGARSHPSRRPFGPPQDEDYR